jgi:hypothetical protein
MAENHSHAAGQSSYEVHEGLKSHPGLDLGLRATFEDSTEAFELAFEYALEFLNDHDPEREGRVSALEIVKVGPGWRETVWRYEHDGSRSGHQDSKQIWGFDASRWRGPDPAASSS